MRKVRLQRLSCPWLTVFPALSVATADVGVAGAICTEQSVPVSQCSVCECETDGDDGTHTLCAGGDCPAHWLFRDGVFDVSWSRFSVGMLGRHQANQSSTLTFAFGSTSKSSLEDGATKRAGQRTWKGRRGEGGAGVDPDGPFFFFCLSSFLAVFGAACPPAVSANRNSNSSKNR